MRDASCIDVENSVIFVKVISDSDSHKVKDIMCMTYVTAEY